jgi:hypothetical protein
VADGPETKFERAGGRSEARRQGAKRGRDAIDDLPFLDDAEVDVDHSKQRRPATAGLLGL